MEVWRGRKSWAVVQVGKHLINNCKHRSLRGRDRVPHGPLGCIATQSLPSNMKRSEGRKHRRGELRTRVPLEPTAQQTKRTAANSKSNERVERARWTKTAEVILGGQQACVHVRRTCSRSCSPVSAVGWMTERLGGPRVLYGVNEHEETSVMYCVRYLQRNYITGPTDC